MTEQLSNQELIAEAKSRAGLCDADTREAVRDTGNIVARLASALEAAERRAEQAEAELKDAYRTDIPSLKEQRDELAAVVEQVLNHDPLHGADSGLHCGGMAPCLRNILDSAPADALRELKADVWDEGADAMAEHIDNGAWWEIQNPYREEQS